jgi:ubiquinone/menaquinone biosynthesis C-methylase UbiE
MSAPLPDRRFAVMLEIARSIGGFMNEPNVAVWDSLLMAQMDGCIQGHLLEIGVFKGRSASVLCQHKRPEEEIWLVDFSPFLNEARTNLSQLQSSGVRFLSCKSSALAREADLAARRRAFRWIHIDGDHTGAAVVNDLNLAADLLSDEGLVCVDDFFNPVYPQITAAVFSWLTTHPFELELVLCGQNKAYLARPTQAHVYLAFIRTQLAAELRARGVTHLTLFKTSPTGDYNGWGLAERRDDRDYYGLDANPDLIL